MEMPQSTEFCIAKGHAATKRQGKWLVFHFEIESRATAVKQTRDLYIHDHRNGEMAAVL